MNLPNADSKCILSVVIAHLPAVCQPLSLLRHGKSNPALKLMLCAPFAHEIFSDSAPRCDILLSLGKKTLGSLHSFEY